MEAVRGRVRDVGRAEYPSLTPAACRDPDIRAGRDAVPCGDGKWVRAQTFGAHEGKAEGRKGRDGVRRGHHACTVGRAVQDQPGQTVDRLVAGDQRAVVVGHEARTARASGQVAHLHERLVGGFAHRFAVPRLTRTGRRPTAAPGARAPSRHRRPPRRTREPAYARVYRRR